MPERLFGKLKEAERPFGREGEAIGFHEISNFPLSRVILNTGNQPKIKLFFDAASENEFLKGFYENILLVYVVDGKGSLILAIEELFRNDSQDERSEVKSGVARFVDHGPHFGLPKLGHPSLLPLGSKQARLAGEIYYRDGVWFINDWSGRYTRPGSDNRQYIENVVAQL